ncbi:uncharacterized protein LOC134022746 [Osmerus eperlanus]|uniref:uncharacterized protein LOC134022746 n=1 Tax=Osmerus eperlanus TaxID=29151 RepID=UPI002E0FAFF8
MMSKSLYGKPGCTCLSGQTGSKDEGLDEERRLGHLGLVYFVFQESELNMEKERSVFLHHIPGTRALELPVCCEQGRLHPGVRIPCFSSCPCADRDMDSPRAATPAALSVNHSFSHSPRSTGRGGGTGLLLSLHIKYTSTPLSVTAKSFEHHYVMLTDPIKAILVVLYRPPGPLANFVEELDMLLSVLPDNGTPRIILGDFNIHLKGTQAVDFMSLLTSFDLMLLNTPGTHKAGKQLDLILTRNCITDLTSVTPLHISDHFFIQLSTTSPPFLRKKSLPLAASSLWPTFLPTHPL